jgi:hypothetical protein
MAKGIYRAKTYRVPFAARLKKTHGKAFAVRFLAFAVRPRRTAKHVFPVVTIKLHI